MVMITAYLDESETPDQPNGYFVVSAIAGPATLWRRIERDWNHVLIEYGIEYLHMKEFAHKAPFLDWDQSKRNSLIGRCAHILESRKRYLKSASCAISAKDYHSMLSESEKREVVHPYFYCLERCALNILKAFNSEKEFELAFVFDERPGFIGRATDRILDLKSNPTIPVEVRTRIVSAMPGDDRKIVPLQVADFLAYELNKHYREPKRRRQSILSINGVKGFHSIDMDRDFVQTHGRPSWA